MPESLNVNLENLGKKAKKAIESEQGKNVRFEKEPVAFGLVALIAGFAIDESLSTDIFEEKLRKIKEVSSVDIIDFRRAIG